MKLPKLTELVGGRLLNDDGREIRGISQVDDVGADELTFVAEAGFAGRLAGKQPGAVLVTAPLTELSCPQIVVADPRLAALQIAAAFLPDEVWPTGIAAAAVVDPSAAVDATAVVMAQTYVGAGAKIGPRTVVLPQVYIGPGAVVGADCLLHPGTRIGARCVLGDKVLCHHNVSIGADGFGYTRIGDRHVKIPQRGIVVIEDEVEIGAGSCVDRATFGRTRVGAGTKIDNLVQIAHNCLIGKRCLLVSQVGLAGSVVVGDDTIFAARASSIPHVRVGRGCIVGAMAALRKDLPDGAMVGGVPAKDHMQWKRELAAVSRLPETLRELKQLNERVEKLEKSSRG